MEGVNIVQAAVTDPLSKEWLLWRYVGDFWWCRHRKKSGRYEFARMMALLDGANQLDGLWDSRRHVTHQQGVIVFRALDPLMKGYIVGRNEYEVFVEWEDRDTGMRGPSTPVKEMELLEFKYIEDFEQYKVIFSNLRKS